MASRQVVRTDICEFARPEVGLSFVGSLPDGLEGSKLPAWQSNGGPTRGLAARSLPFTLEIALPEGAKRVSQIHLVGVFALYAARDVEAFGTLGASVHLVSKGEATFRKDLFNGRHYGEATTDGANTRVNGDGSRIRTFATVPSSYGDLAVSLLSIDVPAGVVADRLRFKDLGSPASFLLFDVFVEHSVGAECPFRSGGGGIGLAEIPALVRIGDRVRFAEGVEQLMHAIRTAEDMDEARGQALTFLAMVTAASLEMGGSRAMHRVQLDAARQFDRIQSRTELAMALQSRIEVACGALFRPAPNPSGYLVDRALEHVERNFARPLSDATVSSELGLSTSHFRYLFKEATGQPFHKYVVALRLEKARQLLLAGDLPVSEVAVAVGFRGLSHFSRLFTLRFSVCPTQFRRTFHQIG